MVSAWLSLSTNHLARDEHCEKRLPGVLSDHAHVPKNPHLFLSGACFFPWEKKKAKEVLNSFHLDWYRSGITHWAQCGK